MSEKKSKEMRECVCVRDKVRSSTKKEAKLKRSKRGHNDEGGGKEKTKIRSVKGR